MRITNNMLSQEALSGFQNQMAAIDKANQEASSGIRVAKPSDDPVAVAGIMQSSSGLAALDQYKTNIQTAQSRLTVEDSALSQLTNTLSRAKEIATSQATGTASASGRQSSAQEVSGLLDFVKQLANTQVGGTYIFGGQYSDSPPFVGGAVDPSKPPQGSFKVEIGTQQYVETNHSAQQIFVDSGVVDGLQSLTDALNSNDVPGIQSALSKLDNAFNSVQNIVGDLGARENELSVASTNLDSLKTNLQTFRSGLQDADLSAAVSDLVNRQNSLQAAMAANSKILHLTLANYL